MPVYHYFFCQVVTKQKSLATFSHAQARIRTLAVVAERKQAVSENHIRLSAQCTHIVLPSVTKVCNVISAALGPLTVILLKNIGPVGYKQGISVDPLMRPIPPVGALRYRVGPHLSYIFHGRRGLFLRPPHVRDFVKEGYFFVPRYEVWGSKSPYNPRNIRGSDAE